MFSVLNLVKKSSISVLGMLLLSGLCMPLAAQNAAFDQYQLYLVDGSGNPVGDAELDLSPCGLGLLRTGSDGSAGFRLPPGANCYMTIRKPGLQEAIVAVKSTESHSLNVAMGSDRSSPVTGSVSDARSGGPMQDAVVYAKSNTSNHFTRTTTDAFGNYTLRLLPRQEYTVTFAQNSYNDVRTEVKTGQSLSGNETIPPVTLSPGLSDLMAWLFKNPSGIPNSGVPSTTSSPTAPVVSAPVVSKPDVNTAKKITLYKPMAPAQNLAPAQYSAPTTMTAKGDAPAVSDAVKYSVQLRSFALDNPFSIDDLAPLRGLGHLYAYSENGWFKVRLGIWGDYAKAETVRSEAIAHGFGDATIITEGTNNVDLQPFLLDNSLPGTEPVQSASSTQNAAAPAQYSAVTNPPAEPGAYYLRIAALSNPDRFDPKPYQDLGNIEMRPLANGMTLVLLGRFATAQDALAAQNEVHKRGDTAPYAVKDINGKLEKVK